MKILLLEGNPDDAALAKEAILEIEESRRWRRWVRHIDIGPPRAYSMMQLLCWPRSGSTWFSPATRCRMLAASLPCFRCARKRRKRAVILLISGRDDALAVSAIREGAEDCLPKEELDCAPLARALRNAVERRRRTAALRSVILLDAETGLYNRNGFMVAAEPRLQTRADA